MTVSEEANCSTTVKRKTLLEKYEIPVDHLEFDYIKKCNNLKEIERIVKILRSNEEGYYPDLMSCAEEQLRTLNPQHQLLRLETPALSKTSMSPDEWNEVVNDIEDWKDEIEATEKRIVDSGKKGNYNNIVYPAVRKSTKKTGSILKTENSKKERANGCDYDKWDKFDADAECLKMDVEEERKKEEKLRKEKEDQARKAKEAAMSREEKELKEIKEVTSSWSDAEKEVYALKEKDLGNEFYKGNEFEKALRHYTRSIAVYPTAVAYNNRAATYLKQCKYSKALEDTNVVLQMEPDNVKAFYRRALALQHKNEFHKALDDIREVLKREPNHVIARHVADQLREHCESMPKKVKLLMKDEEPNDNPNNLKVVEVTQDEMLRDYSDKKFIEVNDWGLPKIMCNCNGKYINDPGIQHDSNVRYQHLHKCRSNPPKNDIPPVRKYEKENKSFFNKVVDVTQTQASKVNNKVDFMSGDDKTNKPKRLEILELEKIVEEEDSKTCESTSKLVKNVEPKVEEVSEDSSYEFSKSAKKLKQINIIDINGNSKKDDAFDFKSDAKAEYLPSLNGRFCAGDEKMDESNAIGVSEREDDDDDDLNLLKETPEFGLEKDVVNNIISELEMCTDSNPESEACSSEQRKTQKTKTNEMRRHSRNTDIEELLEDFDSLPQPIMVAKKYREKVSTSKVVEKSFSDPGCSKSKVFNVVSGSELLDNKADNSLSFYENGNLSPFQFWHNWEMLLKDKSGIEKMAHLLRSVPPHLLQAVIGNKLDDIVLSTFLHCLHDEFNLSNETELITEYLTAFMQLERFQIIYSFLSADDQKLTQDLLDKLGLTMNSQLRKAYA